MGARCLHHARGLGPVFARIHPDAPAQERAASLIVIEDTYPPEAERVAGGALPALQREHCLRQQTFAWPVRAAWTFAPRTSSAFAEWTKLPHRRGARWVRG